MKIVIQLIIYILVTYYRINYLWFSLNIFYLLIITKGMRHKYHILTRPCPKLYIWTLMAGTPNGPMKIVLSKRMFQLLRSNYIKTWTKGQQKGFETSVVFEVLQFKPLKFNCIFFDKLLISLEDDWWEISSPASIFHVQKLIFPQQRTSQSFQIEKCHERVHI